MRVDGVPACCGAYHISGFGYETSDYPPTMSEVRSVKNFLKNTVRDFREVAFLSLILNSSQKEFFGDVVVLAGFRPVSVGYNGNSGNTLTHYIWTNKR